VDWLVLKWLGRQPWTWATTAGWIGVLTGGAIVLGSLVRSGDLHYRTLRVIDQADNAVVATVDFAGIYSPQTTFYAVDARDGWWQMPSAEGYGGRGGMRIELPSRQSPEGNVPQEMLINVWNLRFLEGEQIEPAPPLIEADLAVQNEQITGRVTNLSDRPLGRVEFRTKDGVYRADASLVIEAGQTVEVQARRDPAASIDPQPHPHSYGPWGYYGEVQSPTEPDYVSAGDLSIRRSQRVEGMLRQREDIVCVYATVRDAEPAVHLHNDGAIEQHWQVIRALLPLRR
jgi:hypothetical protein